MQLRPPVALVTAHPKARLCCFMFLPLFLGGGGLCFAFVLLCFTLRPFQISMHLDGKERVGCCALIVCLMSCVTVSAM